MRRIVRGDLASGDLLPRELELAAEYGVNRGVVREAVKLLEVHRLVRPVKRRGTVVLDPLQSLSPDVLAHFIGFNATEIDANWLTHFSELRAVIDEFMVSLAARRRGPADLAAMDVALLALAETVNDDRAYTHRVDDLALAVARATQNPLFEMLVHWQRRVVQQLEALFVCLRASPGNLRGARLIVDAIRQGDELSCRQLIRAYHRWAKRRLLASAAELRRTDSAGVTSEELG